MSPILTSHRFSCLSCCFNSCSSCFLLLQFKLTSNFCWNYFFCCKYMLQLTKLTNAAKYLKFKCIFFCRLYFCIYVACIIFPRKHSVEAFSSFSRLTSKVGSETFKTGLFLGKTSSICQIYKHFFNILNRKFLKIPSKNCISFSIF